MSKLGVGPAGWRYLQPADGSWNSVDRMATETGFSGVVRVDRGDTIVFAKAYGLAHRGCGSVNTVDCQFGIASGTKGLTALTLVSLIEEDRLQLTTAARSLLGSECDSFGESATSTSLFLDCG